MTDIDDSGELDPRRARSRHRLLEAAATLLSSGGVEAVTVDAVTRASRVARTTLYRHFESTTDLVTAAFERLVPLVETPDTDGPLRETLLGLLLRLTELVEDAPLQLTTLAWLAMAPGDQQNRLAPLREKVLDHYRVPFDRVLQSEAARRELGDLDETLALAQLVGPLVFAKLSGLRSLSRADCERLVDDFLATHRRTAEPSPRAEP